MKKSKIVLLLVLMSILLISVAGCSGSDSAEGPDDIVTIAHKNYTEQRLTGQLLSVFLEEELGIETKVTELAGTMLCFNALEQGQIDLYAEFTGSAYGAIFEQTEILGIQETYDYVKKRTEEEHGITWLDPLGWNNTYVLTVRAETMDELGISTISDLIPFSKDMVIGGDEEFNARTDGLVGLKVAYDGLVFKEEVAMDQGLTYAALKNGQLDVNSSFSTDGRIEKFNPQLLEDDKNFFPPYFVTPIIRMDYAEQNPDIVAALEMLGGQWTEADMQVYNLMVEEGTSDREVAIMMLQDKGLID